MAINKVFPRTLSKSKDSRFRKKTEMVDALNVRATETLDAFVNGTSVAGSEIDPSGNENVLKPVLGNTLVQGIGFDEPRNQSIIGSVEDHSRGHVYFFMWSSNQDDHSVLRYDDANQTISKVYSHKMFNFFYNSVVQGSITHVSSAEYGEGTGEKTFLYFTDNYNEPRCLDIEACLNGDPLTYSDNEVAEFISLCPITPLEPIVTEWGYDNTRPNSNFRNSKGLQFAYQCVYRNGTVSAFSIYSKIAINPAYISQGADPTAQVDTNNFLSVRIPTQRPNVDYVKLYGREGNDGPWFFIQEFRDLDTQAGTEWTGPFSGFYTELSDGTEAVPYNYNSFKFYNDKVVSYVPEDITFKQFDSVPKLAEALDISNDRVFMGNYVEGFDKVPITSRITYSPQERPEDFKSFQLKLVPEVRALSNQLSSIDGSGGVVNRVSGYRLDMSDMPPVIEAGTTLNISVNVNPDQDIHLYQSRGSFHTSTFVTHNDPNDGTKLKDRIDEGGFFGDAFNSIFLSDPEFHPGKACTWRVTDVERSYQNKTLHVRDIGWDPIASIEDSIQNAPSASWVSNGPAGTGGEEIEVAYGTSATNPLILQGKPMSFFVRIFVSGTVSRGELSSVIGDVLTGKEVVPSGTNAPPPVVINNNISVLDVKSTSSYTIDCGLNDLSYISSNSNNFKRITYCMERSFVEGNPNNTPPCGYFIVNKADVTFGLVKITNSQVFDSSRRYSESSFEGILLGEEPSTQSNDVFLALDLVDMGQAEVLTCLPDIDGGYCNTGGVGVSNLIHDRSDNLILHTISSNVEGFSGGGEAVAASSYPIRELILSTIERGSNKISGWVCVSRGRSASILNGSTTSLQAVKDMFSSSMCAYDVARIASNNFDGGQFRHYFDLVALQTQELGSGIAVYPNQNNPVGSDNNPFTPAIITSGSTTGWTIWGFQEFSQSDYYNPDGITPPPDVDYNTQTYYELFELLSDPAQRTWLKIDHNEFLDHQISRLVGYINPPGRSVGNPDDPITAVNDPRPGAQSGVGTGRLVCTRTRIIEEFNSQFETNLSIQGEAENILINVLGHTLVDGESGVGSNRLIGSVNTTMIRDGVYYGTTQTHGVGFLYNLQDLSAQTVNFYGTGQYNGWGIGDQPTNFSQNQNGQFTGGGEIGGDSFEGVHLGFLINPCEYYMPYISLALDPHILFTPLHSSVLHFDGQTGGVGFAMLTQGGENINFESFESSEYNLNFEEDGIEPGSLYTITEPMGWYRQLIPHVEITQQTAFAQYSSVSADRKTFKSNANHAFGVVYSDFYGRQSSVQPLGTLFIPPYEMQDGGTGGAVDVIIDIINDPPSWAHSYQIVYAGNTSYDKYIQYSSGGGFVVEDSSAEGVLGISVGGNIYVSLNYLQSNNDVSYAKAFGARNAEGSDSFYEYRRGDKLRIISYYEGGNRIFANNIEFDVVGKAVLADNDDNPLWSSINNTPVPNYLQGEFVILRNNPGAIGFNINSIIQGGGNQLPNQSSLWNNRCIFELYSPASLSDIDDKVFREIGESYKVVSTQVQTGTGEQTVYHHQYNPITLREGDTYFRRHAVNLPLPSNGSFPSIINDNGPSTPQFFNYYLESSTFNDNVIDAAQYDYGRAKLINPNESEIRRYASVIFSDQDDYTDTILRLNSFDATKQPYKDLPNKYGSIKSLIDYNESLFVLQETKSSILPVNRTIVSDLSGSESIIATSKVLGSQKFYAGENGCGFNPESVAVYGNTIFWVNAYKGEVYKFSPSNGVQKISDLGMKAYFKNMFRELIEDNNNPRFGVKVNGGYDPAHDEYIISAYSIDSFDFTYDVVPEQDVVDVLDIVGDEFVDLNQSEGDLTAEEEAVVLADLEAAIETLENSNELVNDLQNQIAILSAQLAEETSSTGGGTPASVQELIDEISELQEAVSSIDDTNIIAIQRQVNYHTTIKNFAISTVEAAKSALEIIGYTIIDNQLVQLGDYTSPLGVEVVSYAGQYNLPVDIAASLLFADLNLAFELIDAFSDETAIYERYFAYEFNTDVYINTGDQIVQGIYQEDFEYKIGYGAGIPVPPDSYLGQLIGNVSGFGNFENPTLSLYEILTNHLSELQAISVGFADFTTGYSQAVVDANIQVIVRKNQLLNQIGELSKALLNTDIPDVEAMVNLGFGIENIPSNPNNWSDYASDAPYYKTLGDLTEEDFAIPGQSTGSYAFAKSAYDYIKNVSDQYEIYLANPTIENELIYEEAIFETSGSGSGYAPGNYIERFIKLGFEKWAVTPLRDQYNQKNNQLQAAEVSRDAIAYALTIVAHAAQTVTDDSLLNNLIISGLQPTVAAALTSSYNSPAEAYASVIASLDGIDGSPQDQEASAAEIAAALPTAALEAAFQLSLGSGDGNVTVVGGGNTTWEGTRNQIQSLLQSVLELSEKAGVINPVTNEDGVSSSYSLNDIGLFTELQEALEDQAFIDGEVIHVLEVLESINNRINGENDEGGIIEIFESLKTNFSDIATLGQRRGYSLNYGIEEEGLQEILENGEIYSSLWQETASQVAIDIDQALAMLQDFQQLLAYTNTIDGGVPEINEGLLDQENGFVNSGLAADQYFASFTPIGLAGPNVVSLLSGKNFQFQRKDGSETVDGWSTFYGLSSIMGKVNRNIKVLFQNPELLEGMFNSWIPSSLIESFDTEGVGLDNNLLNPVNASAITNPSIDPAVKNLSFILPGDANSDLTAGLGRNMYSVGEVAQLVGNVLNPNSEYYNPSFAEAVRNFILLPQAYLGNELGSAKRSDLDNSGLVDVNDLLDFLLNWDELVDPYIPSSDPGAALAALSFNGNPAFTDGGFNVDISSGDYQKTTLSYPQFTV